MGKSLLGLARHSGEQNMSSPSSNSNSNSNSKPSRNKESEDEARKALEQAIVPIETRLESGARLWEQDFSSMSSYGSQDLEVYKIVQKTCKQGLECNFELELESHPEASRINPSMSSGEAESSCSSSGGDPVGILDDDELMSKRISYSRFRRSRSISGMSLSAELPGDVAGPAKNSIPMVMQSCDPYRDFRESISQMVEENGIYEWEDLQELLYCFIKLNSPELYHLITSAFVHVLVQLQRESGFGSEECLDFDWP